MLKLVALAFFLSAQAQAYYDSTFQLMVKRESIRDSYPLTMASSMILHARYDDSGTCFVVSAATEYPCKVELYGRPGFVLSFADADFQKLLQGELQWDQPEFKAEFSALAASTAAPVLVGRDYFEVSPEQIFVRPIYLKSRDGKVTYTVQ